jgi:hypothetical protein
MDWPAWIQLLAGARDFFFFSASRPALGPTQRPVQWVPGAVSPGVERQEREADHSPPFSAEVKNDGTISPLPSDVVMT